MPTVSLEQGGVPKISFSLSPTEALEYGHICSTGVRLEIVGVGQTVFWCLSPFFHALTWVDKLSFGCCCCCGGGCGCCCFMVCACSGLKDLSLIHHGKAVKKPRELIAMLFLKLSSIDSCLLSTFVHWVLSGICNCIGEDLRRKRLLQLCENRNWHDFCEYFK